MFFDNPTLAPQRVTITAEEQGKILACVEITRLHVLPEPEITRQSVRENGLIGTLFHPLSPGPHPTVIVLGGGDGGLREGRAALLASHGYVTLALAYFGIESLPDELLEIPLEYFEKAINWLTTRKMVDAERIAVMGQSKGGELALLLGATYPKIRAVIAYVPNAVVCQGLSVKRASQKSSWSINGKGLDHMPCITPSLDKPTALEPFCSKCLENTIAVERTTIPVENINGPVLLISAKDDQVNPSSRMADMVVSRLTQYNHPYTYEHYCYEGAGHAIDTPYLPTTGQVFGNLIFGGEPQANAFASADSWRAVLDFLDRHLH
jgi:dienelactone hydrolase